MAAPSDLPSAATLAEKAKQKYDSIYGGSRDPLPESIEDQTQYFFERGELATVYLRTFIDQDAFAAPPNAGHFAAADLLLVQAIETAVSTNVDILIETAGQSLFGYVGVGVSLKEVASLPSSKSPLLKIHGCWSDLSATIWAKGQIEENPIRTRLQESSSWLTNRLLDVDLVIIGYCTDWDYLNEALGVAFEAVSPARVLVVDPGDASVLERKAPGLFALGNRASEFLHVRQSGDAFLNDLRVEFSRTFVRRVLHSGRGSYSVQCGTEPPASWLEPQSQDATTLWRIRRDLEGVYPNEPAILRDPPQDPLLGMTLLQLRAAGASPDGSYWNLGGDRIRVIRAAIACSMKPRLLLLANRHRCSPLTTSSLLVQRT